MAIRASDARDAASPTHVLELARTANPGLRALVAHAVLECR